MGRRRPRRRFVMTRVARAVTFIAATLVLAWVAPQRAHAYPDVFGFDTDAAEGGGGGRHFTGSIKDGLTCAVCHTAKLPPRLEVSGIPPVGYTPGQQYNVEVR